MVFPNPNVETSMICAERIRLKQEFDLLVIAALLSNEMLAEAGFPNRRFVDFIGDANDANRRGEAARTAYISHVESHGCTQED